MRFCKGLLLSFVAIVAFAIVAALKPIPAGAQTEQQKNRCISKDGATPDLQIGGCTAAIQSGKISGKNLAVAFYNRGNAYNSKKDYDRAIADYDQAIRIDPQARRFSNRGLVYYKKKDFDRAISDCDQAIRLDPKHAPAFYNRGLAKQAKGDAAGGDADIARARQLQPGIGQ